MDGVIVSFKAYHKQSFESLYPPRGFALYYQKGNLGYTVGEHGARMFFELHFLFLKFHYSIRLDWRELPNEQST